MVNMQSACGQHVFIMLPPRAAIIWYQPIPGKLTATVTEILCSLPGVLIQLQAVATHASIHFAAPSSFPIFGWEKNKKNK